MAATLKCQRCGNSFEALRVDAKWCHPCRDIRSKERQKRYEATGKEPCPSCGGLMTRRSLLCIICENKSRTEKFIGAQNPNWKNGWTDFNGYHFIRVKPLGQEHPYRPEHRLVWEKINGPIPDGWIIHHLNGVKNDNRIENLNAMPRSEHKPRLIVEPYEKRILELEQKLNEH